MDSALFLLSKGGIGRREPSDVHPETMRRAQEKGWEVFMEMIVKAIFGSAIGLGCGFISRLWIRKLYEKRNLNYELNKRTEYMFFAAMTLMGAVIGAFTSGPIDMASAFLLLTIAGTVTVTDWTYRVIPNPTVLAVFGLKFLLWGCALFGAKSIPAPGILQSILGFAICFILFSISGLFGKKVGAGDVKLAAAMGFLLGAYGSLVAITLMGLLILAFCVLQRQMSFYRLLRTSIPMGPFITLGMLAACIGMPYLIG